MFKMMAQIPGPGYTFPYGNLQMIWKNSYINDFNSEWSHFFSFQILVLQIIEFESVLTGLIEIYKDKGICKFYLMHNPSLLIFDHKLVEVIWLNFKLT